MSKKLLQKALSAPSNFKFADMIRLADAFGFRLSPSTGSHHIFVHPQVTELLNLQEVRGKAKPYQIRQFLRLVEKYNLEIGEGR
jgi:predicted RNA binding protein YcfA (HicA-like mRNA interferase family)